MVREMEKWSRIRIRDRITTKNNNEREILRCCLLYNVMIGFYRLFQFQFQWNRLITFAVILLTYSDIKTDNKIDRITSLAEIISMFDGYTATLTL